MAINNVCQNIACWREFHADRWEPYCSPECRQVQNARLTVPYSIPAPAGSELRAAPTRRQRIPGRDLLEADRRKAAPTPKERAEAALRLDRGALAVASPKGTMSIRQAREALAATSAQDSERLNSERENDMHIRAAGLVPHHAGLEERRSNKTAGKLRDLTG
jgi:hypothetical protein